MAVLDFEAVFVATFAIFGAVSGVKTSSRRLVTWDQVQPEDQPALFQRQLRMTAVRTHKGVPAKWEIYGELVVYVNAGSDPDVIPTQTMNSILNQIKNIFEPPPNAVQTLGIPNVTEAAIVGDVLIDEGTADGQAIALIPFRITAV